MATSGTKNVEKNTETGEVGDKVFHGMPPMILKQEIQLYGATVPMSPLADIDPVTLIKNVRNQLQIRDDDIFVLAFPKCGTHWIWEVTHMLVNQTTKYETRTKEFAMVEFSKIPSLEAEPSPRILNSHLMLNHLPSDIVTKKSKIIHVVRNPKDTLVSMYCHAKQIPHAGKDFTFDNLVKAYIANIIMAHNQFEYLRHVKEFEKSHPDHPIKHVYYEEMKKDPVKIIKEIAEFLQVPASDSFCEDIGTSCSFDKMKKLDENRAIPKEITDRIKWASAAGAPKLQLYRKGTVGDWKNHFTVAQNEAFNDFIAKEVAKGLDFQFTYE